MSTQINTAEKYLENIITLLNNGEFDEAHYLWEDFGNDENIDDEEVYDHMSMRICKEFSRRQYASKIAEFAKWLDESNYQTHADAVRQFGDYIIWIRHCDDSFEYLRNNLHKIIPWWYVCEEYDIPENIKNKFLGLN